MLWVEGYSVVVVVEYCVVYLGGVVFECKVLVIGSWLCEIRNFVVDLNLFYFMFK